MELTSTGSSLVANVTPWWWKEHWDARTDLVKRAITGLIETRRVNFTQIEVSRDGVSVAMRLGRDDDANRLTERMEQLREALDAMLEA